MGLYGNGGETDINRELLRHSATRIVLVMVRVEEVRVRR
jgi:hypothetical protein